MIRLFLLILLTNFLITNAQTNFEGEITCTILKGKEEINRHIWVKGDSIRVEETIGNNQKKKSIYIIDGKAKVGYVLSPERKMYMLTKPYEPSEKIDVTDATILERDSLLGYQVENWNLNAEDLKRSIRYSFSPDNFYFYTGMLQGLPERSFLERLFIQLPVAENVMPLLAEFTDINDQRIYQMKVTQITHKVPAASLFKIPKSYQQF